MSRRFVFALKLEPIVMIHRFDVLRGITLATLVHQSMQLLASHQNLAC